MHAQWLSRYTMDGGGAEAMANAILADQDPDAHHRIPLCAWFDVRGSMCIAARCASRRDVHGSMC